jgi:hypothetical protein
VSKLSYLGEILFDKGVGKLVHLSVSCLKCLSLVPANRILLDQYVEMDLIEYIPVSFFPFRITLFVLRTILIPSLLSHHN